MRVPPTLQPGARVALIAPSGPLRDADVQHAIDATRSFGWEPVVGAHVRDRDGYLAGSDAHRLADFNRYASDDSIDGLWCIRGGYGAMRLLSSLDYDAWRRRPLALIGYSDITALHAALSVRAQVVTYHGPTARSTLTAFTRASFQAALIERADSCGRAPGATVLRDGWARGRLTGGNLALVAALMGTPFQVAFDGAILVLEDVNEPVYRIDRMLTQISLSGAADRLAGIAFGQFTEIPDEATLQQGSLAAVLQEFADRTNVPCLSGVPLGHVADQWTVPLGAVAELNTRDQSLTVVY